MRFIVEKKPVNPAVPAMSEFLIKPIGILHSPFKEPQNVPYRQPQLRVSAEPSKSFPSMSRAYKILTVSHMLSSSTTFTS